MPVRTTPAPGYEKRSDGKYHKPYRKGTTKGERRKGAKVAGARKAYDATKDSRKRKGASASRAKGVTTKKGMSRVGAVAGARLAFDDTSHEFMKLENGHRLTSPI